MSVPPLTRRSVLSGAALAALGGLAGFSVARRSDAAGAKSITSAANGYGPGADGGGRVLTTVDKLAARGGVLVGGVVVTRDVSGAVHAVSATCTHQGCTVAPPRGGTVSCPCHGSVFNATTGAVLQGPASRPLPPIAVTVRGNQVVRA